MRMQLGHVMVALLKHRRKFHTAARSSYYTDTVDKAVFPKHTDITTQTIIPQFSHSYSNAFTTNNTVIRNISFTGITTLACKHHVSLRCSFVYL